MAQHRIGWFISPHGFGHAARAAAVMEGLRRAEPEVGLEIFTRVPDWFFQDSLVSPFGYHPVLTDVGLVQETSLKEDVSKTIERLDRFFPFDPAEVEQHAGAVKGLGCECILCDIAPLGIAVARRAGIPSILVENFTWDWIYEAYAGQNPDFRKHIAYLKEMFDQADYHVQTEPVCNYTRADLITGPVSRPPRRPAGEIREELGIPAEARAVLITMGGIPARHAFIDQLAHVRDTCFIIPGAVQAPEIQDNVILLPHRSRFYHPDLLNACDAVVGKSGYSTVAEAYHAGIPFGYVSREHFREAEPVARFIRGKMTGLEISKALFEDGRWLAVLPHLLSLPRLTRNELNGSAQVAEFILSII